MRSKTFIFLIFIFSMFFVLHCAGTKKKSAEPGSTSKKDQQKDLDDIEALLGISPAESQQTAKPKPAPRANQEKLKLLDTNEINQKQSNSSASTAMARQQIQKEDNAKKYEQQVQKLKKQLQQKDKQIAQLNALVDEQNAEINKLSTSRPAPSYSAVGAISQDDYKNQYDQARAAFEARDYQTALQTFQALLATSTTNSLSDNAQYWIGECHYALRQYDAAIIDFEKVLTFPRSNKKADAQFKLGLCYIRKGQKDKAIEEFNRLQEDFPNSPYTTRARAIMAKL